MHWFPPLFSAGIPCAQDQRQWCWNTVCYEGAKKGHIKRSAWFPARCLLVSMSLITPLIWNCLLQFVTEYGQKWREIFWPMLIILSLFACIMVRWGTFYYLWVLLYDACHHNTLFYPQLSKQKANCILSCSSSVEVIFSRGSPKKWVTGIVIIMTHTIMINRCLMVIFCIMIPGHVHRRGREVLFGRVGASIRSPTFTWNHIPRSQAREVGSHETLQ